MQNIVYALPAGEKTSSANDIKYKDKVMVSVSRMRKEERSHELIKTSPGGEFGR